MLNKLTKEAIKKAFQKDIIIKLHAYERIRLRGLSLDMIENAILDDDIVERYPDDYPISSVLLLGFDETVPIHVICAPSDIGLIIISVYIPNRNIWLGDYKTRINKEVT